MEQIVSRSTLSKQVDFVEGALFLIDKPQFWTSFDVVNKIRFSLKHKLGVKKFKVGHAGTLDPLATGLLLLCCGKYTKGIENLQNKDKEYTFEVKFGASTPSYDAETEEENVRDVSHINEKTIHDILSLFTGDILQKPPMFSAIKKDGKALYKLAREGKKIEVEPRAVRISEFELLNYTQPFGEFRVYCTKGTYIRSLAHDIGEELKCGAYVSKLRRNRIDHYDVEDALSIDEVIEYIDNI